MLSLSKDYPVVELVGPTIVVGYGYGKVGVDPRTTHFISQKFDFWIYGGNFVLSRVREH